MPKWSKSIAHGFDRLASLLHPCGGQAAPPEEDKAAWVQHYLQELLAQQAHVPQVANSDNALVNLLLNSRLAQAKARGLLVKIDRLNVPAQLPLPDVDTTSLLLNILDHAMAAAEKAEKQPGTIRLNLNRKKNYFTLMCENSVAVRPTKAGRFLYHGIGLHSIERILTPYGNLMAVRQEPGLYSITLALPLPAEPHPF